MALIKCRECEAQVSTEALSCPHCGVPRPSSVLSEVAPTPTAPAAGQGAGLRKAQAGWVTNARWWSSKPVIAVGAALLGVLGSSIALKVNDANRDSVAHTPSATKAADSAHVEDDADLLRAAQQRLAWADSFRQAHSERLRIYGQRGRQLFAIKDTIHWPDVESTYNWSCPTFVDT